jgi:hypothetical protein
MLSDSRETNRTEQRKERTRHKSATYCIRRRFTSRLLSPSFTRLSGQFHVCALHRSRLRSTPGFVFVHNVVVVVVAVVIMIRQCATVAVTVTIAINNTTVAVTVVIAGSGSGCR